MPSIEEFFTGKYARDLFLTGIIIGFGGIASVVLGIPLVGYLLTPLFEREPLIWRDVGAVSDFAVGSTTLVQYQDPNALAWAGSTTTAGAYLQRSTQTSFNAFSMYCTHLGCPLHWVPPPAGLFFCPCHGSTFYSDGKVAAGPAQLPMVHLPVRVRNGRVQLQTAHIPVA